MIRKVYHDIQRTGGKAAVEVAHEFLVEGRDPRRCSRSISRFLENYELVRYGAFEIDEETSLRATSPEFAARLDAGIAENRRRLRAFIEELKDDGLASLSDLLAMPEGYQSKTVHTIAHLLDGFFGIDSFFFNLADGSHWLPDYRRQRIATSPESHMLLSVKASIWPPE